MKTAVLIIVCAGGAFFAMHLHQQGLLVGGAVVSPAQASPEMKLATAKFPQELAPNCVGNPAPLAAEFKPGLDSYPVTVLTRKGTLHPWQERLQPDWQAHSVEATALTLILENQKKTLIQTVTYPGGEPPINRYRYDMDAWLVATKTGQTLASKRFTSVARLVQPLEEWALTELGDPVAWGEVIGWVRKTVAEQATPAVTTSAVTTP